MVDTLVSELVVLCSPREKTWHLEDLMAFMRKMQVGSPHAQEVKISKMEADDLRDQIKKHFFVDSSGYNLKDLQAMWNVLVEGQCQVF